MTNTVPSSQWSLSQGNFRHLFSSSVMHIELLFTITYQPTIPIISTTHSLSVIMFLEFISSFTPHAGFKILFFLTIIIIISKNENNFRDTCSIKVFHNGLIQQPERLYLSSLHPVAASTSSPTAAACPV